MRKLFIWAGIILILVGAFLAWKKAHPPLTDEQQISANLEDLRQNANLRRTRGITQHLSSDFKLGSLGKKEVNNQLVGAFLQWGKIELDISGVKTQIKGDEAISNGHFSLQASRDEAGTPETYAGDFKTWWRKEDGVWKIYRAEGTNIPG